MINPSSRAIAVLKELGINDLKGVDLKDIFSLKGIFYDDSKPITGHQARIISTINYSMIAVSSTITYKSQKRFIQAHEFGHYELHRSTPVICDDEDSFFDYHDSGGQEQEANEFAAELLMPRAELKTRFNSSKFDVNFIKGIADYFETSITASAIRYAEFGTVPIAVIFSKDGLIRWKKINQKFPLQFIRVNKPVPIHSAVAGFYNGGSVSSKPVKVAAFDWFYEDLKVGAFDKTKVFEEVFPIPSINSAISLIRLV